MGWPEESEAVVEVLNCALVRCGRREAVSATEVATVPPFEGSLAAASELC